MDHVTSRQNNKTRAPVASESERDPMADRGGGGAGDISDEDQDIDIESDDDDASSSAGGVSYMSEADKKAHHNALERKRRDHIKESFSGLRDCIPALKNEKTSRAQILKQATDYIQFMTNKNGSVQKDIENIRKQNNHLRVRVQEAEKAKAAGYPIPNSFRLPENGIDPADPSDSDDSSDVDTPAKKPKKLKTAK